MSKAAVFFSSFLISYAVYYVTLYPSIPGGDSGELVSEACHLGISHPPGYPLYTIIAHILMKVSIPRLIIGPNFEVDILDSNNAWRAGHFCAVCGALAVGALASTIVEASSSTENDGRAWFCGIVASLVYGFSPLVWEYSITAEVFALNNMLCALLLLIGVRIVRLLLNPSKVYIQHEREIGRLVMLGGFVSGLALCNQHTSLLHISYLVLVIFALMVYTRYAKLWSVLGWTVLAGLCGLSPYSYLYFAGQHHPPGSWGDTSHLFGLIRHILRAEYGTFQLGIIQGSETWWERIQLYLRFSSQQSYAHTLFPVLIIGTICFILVQALKSRNTSKRWSPNESKQSVPSTTTKKLKGSSAAKKLMKEKEKDLVSIPSDAVDKQDVESENGEGGDEWKVEGCVQLVLWGSWLFYTLLWHTIFSNLPLSSPMPYEVHARFWMQPSITLYVLFGLNLHHLLRASTYFLTSPTWFPKKLKFVGDVTVAIGGIAIVSGIVADRWDVLNHNHWENRHDPGRSYDYSIHQYANLTWQTIPDHSLVLAHTDLDWNPMRYFRVCSSVNSEFRTKNVTHLSFQLIAFPWFEHYKNHYPTVQFPNLKFPGISTDRRSPGNRELVMRMLMANGVNAHTQVGMSLRTSKQTPDKIDWTVPFPGGVYIDMQSINDVEIQDMGRWYDFYLIPWGTQYRVFHRQQIASRAELELLQLQAWQKHSYLRDNFVEIDARWAKLHREGSWERAVANVLTDSSYQLGLFYLTYAMEEQNNLYALLKQEAKRSGSTSHSSQKSIEVLLKLFDRLLASLDLLSRAKSNVVHYETISSSKDDVLKNTALAYMRCSSISMVVKQFAGSLRTVLAIPTAQEGLIMAEAMENSLSEIGWKSLLVKCEQELQDFVIRRPSDPDHSAFQSALAKVQSTLSKLK